MTRHEDLQPTAAVRGILPDQVVKALDEGRVVSHEEVKARASGSSSADEFLDAALSWFGDPDPSAARNGVGEGRKIGEAGRA